MGLSIHQVPQGSLHVQVIQPMLRFGLAIQIYVQSGTGIYHAHPDENGDLVFRKVDPGSYPDKPTLYVDEELAEALYQALKRRPTYQRTSQDEEESPALQDARKVRDKVIDLLESSLIQDRALISAAISPPATVNVFNEERGN